MEVGFVCNESPASSPLSPFKDVSISNKQTIQNKETRQ